MYDELVKRLREMPIDMRCAKVMREAADAIEELSSDYEKLAEDFNGAVELLHKRKNPRWIPVAKRLPEDIDEEVLVCTEDYGVNDLGFVTVATYGVSGWLESWERRTYLTAVTHWMPLPPAPKEE